MRPYSYNSSVRVLFKFRFNFSVWKTSIPITCHIPNNWSIQIFYRTEGICIIKILSDDTCAEAVPNLAGEVSRKSLHGETFTAINRYDLFYLILWFIHYAGIIFFFYTHYTRFFSEYQIALNIIASCIDRLAEVPRPYNI